MARHWMALLVLAGMCLHAGCGDDETSSNTSTSTSTASGSGGSGSTTTGVGGQCTSNGPETCNGVDDDCDGEIDDGSLCDSPLTCDGANGCACPPENQCGSICADLRTDPVNCGVCGHDCLGGDCSGGECQAIVLAEMQSRAWDLVLDDTTIYWVASSYDAIRKMPKAGGTVTELASTPSPFHLAVDATHVYWTASDNTVNKVPIDGGSVTVLASAQQNPAGLCVDATSVYWANFEIGTDLQSVPLSGGSPTALVSNITYVRNCRVAGGDLFYLISRVAGSGMWRVPTTGGTPVELATSGRGNTMTMDASNVYWTSYDGGDVYMVPKAGGNRVTISDAEDTPQGIAVDATHAYWVDQGNGRVRRASLPNGAPETVLSGQGEPLSIGLDDEFIYFGTKTDLRKVAK